MINPLQAFWIRTEQNLSMIELQSLTLFYQPLMDSQAVSVYLTLLSWPRQTPTISYRSTHADLIQVLNLSPLELEQALKQLAGLGLLRTYHDQDSHLEYDRQTLFYDLYPPLTPAGFLDQPILSVALYQQVGEDHYQQLVDRLQPEALASDRFREVTATFSQVYPTLAGQYDLSPPRAHDRQQGYTATYAVEEGDFDYGRLLSYLISDGIDHSQLTQALKQEVLAVQAIYQLSEEEMTEIVSLAKSNLTGQIELDQLKQIADRRNYYQDRRQGSQRQPKLNQAQGTQQPAAEASAASFPYDYDDQARQARIEAIHQQLPNLSEGNTEIILLAEQLPNVSFLAKTKESKGGFATDAEIHYVSALADKTQLPPEVINLLIYYLLVYQKRDNIYKGDIERHASEWQQHQLTSPTKAMEYILYKTKEQQVQTANRDKDKQHQARHYKKPTKQELIPSWMQEAATADASAEAVDPEREAAIRAELRKLLGKEDSS